MAQYPGRDNPLFAPVPPQPHQQPHEGHGAAGSAPPTTLQQDGGKAVMEWRKVHEGEGEGTDLGASVDADDGEPAFDTVNPAGPGWAAAHGARRSSGAAAAPASPYGALPRPSQMASPYRPVATSAGRPSAAYPGPPPHPYHHPQPHYQAYGANNAPPPSAPGAATATPQFDVRTELMR